MVVLVLPPLFCMFLLDLVLGLVSSFIPQMNVTILAMGLKTVIALLIMLFYIGVLYHVILSKFVLYVQQALA